MSERYKCPICLGSKQLFNGKSYNECKQCDENGEVARDFYELFYEEDD